MVRWMMLVQQSWLLAVLIATYLWLPSAQAQSSERSLELTLAICNYTRDNDIRQLQQKLLEARLRLRDIYASVRCNQTSLLQFALSHNANEIARYFAMYANVRDLVESGDIEFIERRALLDTPVGQVLKQRLLD